MPKMRTNPLGIGKESEKHSKQQEKIEKSARGLGNNQKYLDNFI